MRYLIENIPKNINMNYKILIWGAKSKALILINMLRNNEFFDKKKKIIARKVKYLVDPFLKEPEFETKIPFINNKKEFLNNINNTNSFIVGIGGHFGKARTLISKELIKRGLRPINAIHKSSIIDKTSFLGDGTQIMPNAVVHCHSQIGDFSILNTSSVIEHECEIGIGTHIMAGACVAGKVKIGNYVTIGTNATIFPNVKISDGAFIGAGSVIRKNVKENEVIAGNPGRFLRKNSHYYNLDFFKSPKNQKIR